MRFVDLFCGIGGFHRAVETVARELKIEAECVFACDSDPDCQRSYAVNFGLTPAGDITLIEADGIPDHDLLLAGFPCQPFSICGRGQGFEDARGKKCSPDLQAA